MFRRMPTPQKKPRVINVLVYGGTGGSGGFDRYCKGLLGSEAVPPDLNIYFLCSPEFKRKLKPLDAVVQTITHPWMSSRSRLKRLLWHIWLYPQLIRRKRIIVEFYPSGILPLLRRIVPGRSIIATTCHNLLPFDLIEFSRKSEQQVYRNMPSLRKNIVTSLSKSSIVIFLSDYSKHLIMGQLTTNPKCAVIEHGLDSDFKMRTSRSYDISDVVTLLYVSPLFPYKHQMNVVRAVKELRNITRRDVRLRLVGGGDPEAVRDMQVFIENENSGTYVSLLANLNREDLKHEYCRADIFVFASSCETFGITLLEAMGFKLPIACSNRSGLSDILRDAGVYFDPEDHQSLIRALNILMSNAALRKSYGEKASEYARKYTWSECASETFRFISESGNQLISRE